jgi:hypothetical protein
MASSRVASVRQPRRAAALSALAKAPMASPGRPGASLDGHRLADDTLDGRDQLTHRDAVTLADVEIGVRRPLGLDDVVELLDRADVGLGEVPGVDVVADAGAVAGRQVRAGDREAVAVAERGLGQQRHDVRRVLEVVAGLEVGVGAVLGRK